MRAIAFVIVFLLLGFILQWIGPWWLHLVAAFLVAFFFGTSERSAFGLGLLGGVLLWGIWAAYLDLQNGGILSRRMGILLGEVPRIGVWALAALLGSLLAGPAAWYGMVVRRSVWPIR
jgi:hypothetical protein